jgi:hypothetical protein
MFKLPAVMFAMVMGFFMSMTNTFFLSLINAHFSMSFLVAWLHVWPMAYPIAVIAIIIWRPVALYIAGALVRLVQSR